MIVHVLGTRVCVCVSQHCNSPHYSSICAFQLMPDGVVNAAVQEVWGKTAEKSQEAPEEVVGAAAAAKPKTSQSKAKKKKEQSIDVAFQYCSEKSLAHPPPPPKTQNTPPKWRSFMGMEFFLQAEPKIPRRPLAQPFPAAELREKNYMDTRIFFSELCVQALHIQVLICVRKKKMCFCLPV